MLLAFKKLTKFIPRLGLHANYNKKEYKLLNRIKNQTITVLSKDKMSKNVFFKSSNGVPLLRGRANGVLSVEWGLKRGMAS